MLNRTWAGIALVLAAAVLGLAPKGLMAEGRAAELDGVVIGNPVLTRTPLRPSFVIADFSVTQGGAAVLPTGATCSASFAGDKAYGIRRYEGRFVRGLVRCGFAFNNARYRGKTLVGELTVFTGKVGSSGGGRSTKRFSVRIGPGNALDKPVGATVKSSADTPKPSATTQWRGTLHLVHVDGGPGQPGWNTSLDLRLTLLPGATKTEPLSWAQPVSWVGTYSAEFYGNTPCTDPSGRAVPNRLEERTTLRGRTGDKTSSYPNSPTFRENAKVSIRWDARRSQWVAHFNGTRPRRFVTKITSDCGRTWRTETGIGGGFSSYTIRVDGTAAATTLKGQGRPDNVPDSDNATATWDLTLGPAK